MPPVGCSRCAPRQGASPHWSFWRAASTTSVAHETRDMLTHGNTNRANGRLATTRRCIRTAVGRNGVGCLDPTLRRCSETPYTERRYFHQGPTTSRHDSSSAEFVPARSPMHAVTDAYSLGGAWLSEPRGSNAAGDRGAEPIHLHRNGKSVRWTPFRGKDRSLMHAKSGWKHPERIDADGSAGPCLENVAHGRCDAD